MRERELATEFEREISCVERKTQKHRLTDSKEQRQFARQLRKMHTHVHTHAAFRTFQSHSSPNGADRRKRDGNERERASLHAET